jgi:hypothetical protein
MKEEIRALLQEIYEWMQRLDTEDGRDHVDEWIELMPKVAKVLKVEA